MLGLSSIAQPAAANDRRPRTPIGRRPGVGSAPIRPWRSIRPPPPPGYHPPGLPLRAAASGLSPPDGKLRQREPGGGALVGAGIGRHIIASQLGREHDNGGATVFGLLAGAVVGGALGQAADRANGCY